MKISISEILHLLKREIDIIKIDKNLISVLLIAPIFYSFFYASIYFNKVETDVPILIVDNDHSSTSNKFIHFLNSHQLISVKSEETDLNSAKAKILNGEAQAIIYIPSNFETELKSCKGSNIKSFLNTSRFLISNDINKAVNEIAGTMGAGIRMKFFQSQGFNSNQAKEMIDPLRVEIRPMFNFTESYGDFMIPSLLILILHQTLLLGLSESVAKEREQNTITELFEKAKGNISQAIIGKGLFYVILYSIYAAFFFSVNFYLFKIPFNGNVFAFALATILMLIAAVFMSIFISSFFERKIIAIQFLTLSSYPIFLISGYSWPMQSLPISLQILANIIPFTPYANVFTKLTAMSAGWNNVLPQIFQLFILALLFFTGAHYRMSLLYKNTQIKP